MAVMTIHNIDDTIKNRLRLRAAKHGRSMENEARDILRSALSTDLPRQDLGVAIHERFGALGGVDLADVAREAIRPPSSQPVDRTRAIARLALGQSRPKVYIPDTKTHGSTSDSPSSRCVSRLDFRL